MATVQEALAGLTFEQDFPDSELISDVVLIAKCVDKDTGAESFVLTQTTGISIITQLGLLTAAQHLEIGQWTKFDEDEDEEDD